MLYILPLFFLAFSHGAFSLPEARDSSIRVDLGYSQYMPTEVNFTGQYYNFSNIRYAAAPVGNLRWRAPQPPPRNRTLNDGSLGYICPQAPPFWFEQANTALGDLAAFIPPALSSQAENEDCLFLDVIVPRKVFHRRHRKLSPVLFNIHGGGFWIGEKRALYPPNGLLEAGNNEFIYVSINYRVGLPLHLVETRSLNEIAWCLRFPVTSAAILFECDNSQCRPPRSTVCSRMGAKVHSPVWR